MKVTVNVDCTPEEARTFLGLPDMTPVHDKYVQALTGAMDGAGVEQMAGLMQSFAPMGDASMRLFRQMMDIGLSGTTGKS
jgi:hypothetical protein